MSPAASGSSKSATATAMPCLPPGFRFHPTDEELIVHYLVNQAASLPCPAPIIAEVNIYTCNPWDLPGKALFGEKEWYFFSPRERKYPNGARPNRAAGEGYWKATGTDKAILATPTSDSIAVKKALVFYKGKPPKGVKTDWIMHEYRLTPTTATASKRRSSATGSSTSMRLDDWVLCRIHKKSNDFFYSDEDHTDGGSAVVDHEHDDSAINIHHHQDYYSSSQQQPPPPHAAAAAAAACNDQPLMSMSKSCSLTDLLSTIDFSTLSQMLLGATPPDDDNALPSQPPALLPLPPTPPPTSPLVFNDTTPQNQNFYHNNNNNINNNNNVNMSQPQEVSDYTANSHNIYSGVKSRKRIMSSTTTDAVAGTTPSFDDGSSSSFTQHVAKKLQLPNNDHSKMSYCNNQQQLQNYGSLVMSNPFFSLNYQQEQQLLLNSHLQMQ